MKTAPEKTTSGRPRFDLVAVLFLVLSYLYVWLAIDPRLIHHSLGILVPYRSFAFRMGWPFFAEHLGRVGGPVEYVARLLSQCYAFGWAGALIVTAAAWSAAFFAERLADRAGWRHGRVLGYTAAVVVLLTHGGYSHPLRPVLSLLISLGGFLLYEHVAPKPPIGRAVLFLFAFLVLYPIVGSGSLIFPALVAVDGFLVERRRAMALLALAIALVVPWVSGTVFGIGMKEAYGGFLVSDAGVAPGMWPHTLALYLLFPTLLASSALRTSVQVSGIPPAASSPPRRDARSRGQEPRRTLLDRRGVRLLGMAAVVCGAVALVWFSMNSFTRTMLEMDYHSQHEQWPDVLNCAERLPAGVYNVRCERNVLLALYHTGRLGDAMCHYGLRPSMDLFSTPKQHRDLGSYDQESRLLLEIGQVNEAEKSAFEALEVSGGQPEVLRRLATISIVKGRGQTARVFLKALEKQPFHRAAARAMLRRLEGDSASEDDPQVAQIRANMVDRDCVVRHDNLEAFAQAALEKNPRNRMAFELLMAADLAARRPDKVVANLPRLKEFSYRQIPLHYQEAWAVYAASSGNPPAVAGFALDPEVQRDAERFRRIAAAAGPQGAARATFEAGFGDSYFFYFTFGTSVR